MAIGTSSTNSSRLRARTTISSTRCPAARERPGSRAPDPSARACVSAASMSSSASGSGAAGPSISHGTTPPESNGSAAAGADNARNAAAATNPRRASTWRGDRKHTRLAAGFSRARQQTEFRTTDALEQMPTFFNAPRESIAATSRPDRASGTRASPAHRTPTAHDASSESPRPARVMRAALHRRPAETSSSRPRCRPSTPMETPSSTTTITAGRPQPRPGRPRRRRLGRRMRSRELPTQPCGRLPVGGSQEQAQAPRRRPRQEEEAPVEVE